MAFFTETHSGAGIAHRLGLIWADYKEEMARRKVQRTTYRELSALSNRELADLGLARGNIRRIAYEAAYGIK